MLWLNVSKIMYVLRISVSNVVCSKKQHGPMSHSTTPLDNYEGRCFVSCVSRLMKLSSQVF